MDLTTSGSLRLFRLAGIDVFVHWSWFAVAGLQIWARADVYQAPAWKVAEYLTLFAIVLLHEYGHALACRSVGGQADRIVLWPLGGIAYVAPPPRPGAVLWSIVAGPLVNLVLMAPLFVLLVCSFRLDWKAELPDVHQFVVVLATMNTGLLVMNLLPVYPLDGGQILHALLWFVVGRWQALFVVSILGVAGGVLLGVGAVLIAAVAGPGGYLLGFIALFIVMRSLVGFQESKVRLRLDALPRHVRCACPACGERPPRGSFWLCEHCQSQFDTFATRGRCSGCGAWFLDTACPYCHTSSHIDQWGRPNEILDAEPVRD